MITLDKFYTVLKSSVRFASKDSWLQTFGVLNSLSDLNSPNLGKVPEDFNKPYFYSRAWEKSDYNTSNINFTYPGLFVIETGKIYNFGNTKRSEVIINLELCVVDRWVEGKLIPEIETQTSYQLHQVIDYLKKVEAYEVGGEVTYLHKEHATWLLTNGHVADLTKKIPETTSFKNAVNQMLFNDVRGFSLGLGSDDLYGSFIQVQIKEYAECYYPEPEWYIYDGYLKDLGCGCE